MKISFTMPVESTDHPHSSPTSISLSLLTRFSPSQRLWSVLIAHGNLVLLTFNTSKPLLRPMLVDILTVFIIFLRIFSLKTSVHFIRPRMRRFISSVYRLRNSKNFFQDAHLRSWLILPKDFVSVLSLFPLKDFSFESLSSGVFILYHHYVRCFQTIKNRLSVLK